MPVEFLSCSMQKFKNKLSTTLTFWKTKATAYGGPVEKLQCKIHDKVTVGK